MQTKIQTPLNVDKVAFVKLTDGYVAAVDEDNYEWLNGFKWKAKKKGRCVYAVRTYKQGGRSFEVSMHRLVAKTPRDKHCHHKNHKSLWNLRANLENLSPFDHATLHGKTPPGALVKYKKANTKQYPQKQYQKAKPDV